MLKGKVAIVTGSTSGIIQRREAIGHDVVVIMMLTMVAVDCSFLVGNGHLLLAAPLVWCGFVPSVLTVGGELQARLSYPSGQVSCR